MITLHSYLCKATGYYPFNNAMEGGLCDRIGKPLCTLEHHIKGYDPFVSVAMDQELDIPYGTLLFIPSFNTYYKRELVFKIVDNGGDFRGKGWGRMDICCMDKVTSEDDFLNRIEGHEIIPMLLRERP